MNVQDQNQRIINIIAAVTIIIAFFLPWVGSCKGVYFISYTEKNIDNKNMDVVTITNYKKTTVFRAVAAVFGTIVGISALVTLSVMLK